MNWLNWGEEEKGKKEEKRLDDFSTQNCQTLWKQVHHPLHIVSSAICKFRTRKENGSKVDIEWKLAL